MCSADCSFLRPGLGAKLFNENLFQHRLDFTGGNSFAVHLADLRVGTLGAANGDVVALAHAAIGLFGFGSGETNGAHVGLAAGVGAARPVDLQFLRKDQFTIQRFSSSEGLILGVGEGKAAVAVAGAADGASGNVAGVQAEALQQWFRFKGLELSAADAGKDHVLIFRQAHAAVAMALGKGGNVLEVFGQQASDGNMDTGVVQVLLLLRVDAVVGAGFSVED